MALEKFKHMALEKERKDKEKIKQFLKKDYSHPKHDPIESNKIIGNLNWNRRKRKKWN